MDLILKLLECKECCKSLSEICHLIKVIVVIVSLLYNDNWMKVINVGST